MYVLFLDDIMHCNATGGFAFFLSCNCLSLLLMLVNCSSALRSPSVEFVSDLVALAAVTDPKAGTNISNREDDTLFAPLSLPISDSSIGSPLADNPTTDSPAASSDSGSRCGAVDATSDGHDTPLPPSTISCLDSPPNSNHNHEVGPDTVAKLVADADVNCKWDMDLPNFPTSTIYNKNVRRFPWLENPSFAWQVVLRVLKSRYPAKPFCPKDPRISNDIWMIFVVQKNRASCNRIIANVAAIYAQSQRELANQRRSEDDELIDLMNNISVRDIDKTPKLPWISKEDPTWVGVLMAMDILFATNPCPHIDNAELHMNYMRVSKYAVALVRRQKPWLAPEQQPCCSTPLHPFSALSAALSPPLSSSDSRLTGNGMKRKQEDIFEDEDDWNLDAEVDYEDDDEADHETDHEGAPSHNSRLKRARID